jgi:catechol 2,3-dioxygenase-like lactoylglutathione lyase family enzyme
VTAPAPPFLSLEEARRRLKDLGYLDGGVERFVFRRAFEGRWGLFLPAVLAGAFAAALACAAAVETAEPWFGRSPGPFGAVLAHFFAASLLPAVLFAAALALAADRTRRPAAGGLAAGLFAGGFAIALWIGGSYTLGGGFLHALVWGVPVSAAALLAAEGARSGFLARAYAHSRRLPERRRRGVFLAVAAAGMIVAASLFGLRREPEVVRPPQPRGRIDEVRVVAVDGLDLDGEASRTPAKLRELFDRGATGWWSAEKGTPPEIWMNLATGVPPVRHGVRALERVRPLGSSLALRPPPGMAWYLRGVGRALGLVKSSPVSATDRRSLAFWEVYSSAGLPSVAVGWWSSGPWPGAAVVGNEEVLARARTGADVDRVALEALAARKWGGKLETVYLPSLDIVRDDPAARAKATGEIESFLHEQAGLAASAEKPFVLIVIAADSHPPEGGLGRMIVFDRGAAPGGKLRIRPEDVAPSILARAGIPVAQDLPGRPAAALFATGSLETATVTTYGPRVAAVPGQKTVTDREYLEKLRSLGYLN